MPFAGISENWLIIQRCKNKWFTFTVFALKFLQGKNPVIFQDFGCDVVLLPKRRFFCRKRLLYNGIWICFFFGGAGLGLDSLTGLGEMDTTSEA
jgi:hypothetical protein